MNSGVDLGLRADGRPERVHLEHKHPLFGDGRGVGRSTLLDFRHDSGELRVSLEIEELHMLELMSNVQLQSALTVT